MTLLAFIVEAGTEETGANDGVEGGIRSFLGTDGFGVAGGTEVSSAFSFSAETGVLSTADVVVLPFVRCLDLNGSTITVSVLRLLFFTLEALSGLSSVGSTEELLVGASDNVREVADPFPSALVAMIVSIEGLATGVDFCDGVRDIEDAPFVCVCASPPEPKIFPRPILSMEIPRL